jgi:hypothetical protein
MLGYNGIERLMGVGFNSAVKSQGSGFPGTGTPGILRLFTPPSR